MLIKEKTIKESERVLLTLNKQMNVMFYKQ